MGIPAILQAARHQAIRRLTTHRPAIGRAVRRRMTHRQAILRQAVRRRGVRLIRLRSRAILRRHHRPVSRRTITCTLPPHIQAAAPAAPAVPGAATEAVPARPADQTRPHPAQAIRDPARAATLAAAVPRAAAVLAGDNIDFSAPQTDKLFCGAHFILNPCPRTKSTEKTEKKCSEGVDKRREMLYNNVRRLDKCDTHEWEHSSVGRAFALQAKGHRFEPCCSHHLAE